MTTAHMFAGWQSLYSGMSGFFPHTPIAINMTYGCDAGGMGGGSDTAANVAGYVNNLISGNGLSAIKSLCMSGADTYGIDWVNASGGAYANGAQQGFAGIASPSTAPGPLPAVNPALSLKGIMDHNPCWEASDYGYHNGSGGTPGFRLVAATALTQAAVLELINSSCNNGGYTQASHIFPSMGDGQTFGNTAWTSYVQPAFLANPPNLAMGVPANFQGAPKFIGTNVAAGGNASLEYESMPIWQDRIMEGRGFLATGYGANLTLGSGLSAAGWPTQDFSTYLYTGGNTPAWQTGGFACGFIGSGSESISGNNCTISSVVHGTGGAYTTFTLTPTGSVFGFQVTGTSGGVTNVYSYLPEYASQAANNYQATNYKLITNEWKALHSSLLGMRWETLENAWFNAATNSSTTRNTPSNTKSHKGWSGGSGSSTEGYPAEWCIEANVAAGCSAIYLNFPAVEDATLTWSQAVLNYLFSNHPTLNVYIEVGNELWNGIGGAGAAIQAAGAAAGFPNTINGAYQYLGVRLHGIANAARSISAGWFASNVNLVLATQGAPGNGVQFMSDTINYMISQGITPSNDLKCAAWSIYMEQCGISSGDSIATIQSKVAAQGAIQATQLNTNTMAIYALANGLIPIAYEAGWDSNVLGTGTTNLAAAIMDAGLVSSMNTFWQTNFDQSSSIVFNYEDGVTNQVAGSGNGFNDEWSNNYSTLITSGTPRLSALQNYLSFTPSFNVVAGSGAIVQGYNYQDNQPNTNLPAFATNGNLLYRSGNYYGWGYLINCTKAGTYALTGYFNTSQSGTLEVDCNATQGATLYSIGNSLSHGAVSMGTVTLNLGKNFVALGSTSAQAGITLYQLGFT